MVTCAPPSPLAGEGALRVSEGRMRGSAAAISSDKHGIDPSSVVASQRHLLPQGEKGRPRIARASVSAFIAAQYQRRNTMKPPRKFFEPLAIGAPAPFRELPVRVERMIHFVPAHLEKVRAKAAEMARQVDVLLGNLEDAIPADAKEAARAGFIEMAQKNDFGGTGLWTRINALNSPWALDDITQIVGAVGQKLDVMMLPKVEGPWDIAYLDQLLAQLEARHGIGKPIMIHAILETAEGVKNVEAIACASPRMHGMSLGPADLAASRAMKTTRVGGGHPEYKVLADPDAASGAEKTPRAAYQQDLWHYTVAKMVDACASAGIKAFYGPFGDIADIAACEVQFRNAFLMGCAG